MQNNPICHFVIVQHSSFLHSRGTITEMIENTYVEILE